MDNGTSRTGDDGKDRTGDDGKDRTGDDGKDRLGEGGAIDPDRPRGILTPSDRDFLLGRKTDYTDHSRRQKRNRIRQRVHNAIVDFTLLFEHLQERDRRTLFDRSKAESQAYTRGVTDTLAFLYLGADGYHTPFGDLLSAGVRKAETKRSGTDYRTVEVEFSVEPVGEIDLREVVSKVRAGDVEEVTDGELRALVGR
ncbi:MAG: hypothetical protein ACQETB_05570, partial [Halobacteriota archaeon]